MNTIKKRNTKNWLTWNEHKKELMKDPGVRKAYQEFQPEFAIIREIIRARVERGITQKKIAVKMKTKQSAISRLESGRANPSLNFLKRLATALGGTLKISFEGI